MGTFVVTDTRENARSLSGVESANRQTVLDYYRAMVEKLTFEHLQPFLNDDYAEHNPAVPAGDLEALRGFCDSVLAVEFSNIFVDVQQTIVDGAFVLLRIAGRLRPDDPTDMVMELFRLRDGKISEHWEVVGPSGTRVIESVVSKH